MLPKLAYHLVPDAVKERNSFIPFGPSRVYAKDFLHTYRSLPLLTRGNGKDLMVLAAVMTRRGKGPKGRHRI